MKTLQIYRAFIAIVLVAFLSCKDQPSQYVSSAENSDLNEALQKKAETVNSDGNSKSAFEKFIKSEQTKKKSIISSNMFDFKTESRVPLPKSMVEIIIVEKYGNTAADNLSLFGFIKNGKIAPLFILNEIHQIAQNHYQIYLKSIDGEIFFSYQMKNKKIMGCKMINNFLSKTSAPTNLSKKSPGTSEIEGVFAECVQSWGEYMVGGTFQGGVTFLFCLAFGPQCAAMITGNCLAYQVESWLGW